jgi:putative ABC transport system ATP-binding protein
VNPPASSAGDAGERPLFAFDHVAVAGVGDQLRLRDVTGEIPARGVTSLVGPSGSGKSTLLRCCNRLEVPSRGTVRYRGTDVADLDPLQLRTHVAMVFQRPTPFPGTCRQNLLVADPALDDDAATALLTRVRLDASFLDREATQLSGGEAQRLCLARALAVRPEVVLMDEVTSSLDGRARTSLEELARNLSCDGVPVVWVTHDFAQVRRIADNVIVVLDGRIAHAAPLASLLTTAPPEVRAFLEEAGIAE